MRRKKDLMQGMLLSSIVVEAPAVRGGGGWRVLLLLVVAAVACVSVYWLVDMPGQSPGAPVAVSDGDDAESVAEHVVTPAEKRAETVTVEARAKAQPMPVAAVKARPTAVPDKAVTPPVSKPGKADEAPALLDKAEARQLASAAGRALFEGQLDKAAAIYRTLSLGAAYPEWGHIGLAKIALQKGDFVAAIAHAKSGVRTGGGHRARLALADALARAGQHREAADQYRLVLKWDANNAAAQQGLAKSEHARKRSVASDGAF